LKLWHIEKQKIDWAFICLANVGIRIKFSSSISTKWVVDPSYYRHIGFTSSFNSFLMNIQKRANELFAQYLNGNCSPAEWEELLVLIAGIGENETEILTEPLFHLWERAHNKELRSTAHLIDREKMFAAIIQEYGRQAETERPMRRIKWRRIAAAAAIVGLLIISGMLYMKRDRNQQIINTTAFISPERVKPGIDKAVLILANGQQIILDSSATGAISKQGNTTVINFNGKLAYEASKSGSNAATEISYNTVTTARANQYQLVLPDGSKVWLNALSSIRFPIAFTGKDRTVEITGETYFEVAPLYSSKGDGSKVPFHVKVAGSDIEVLGTHFNVNAYKDENLVKTSLLEGSVKVSRANKSGKLVPGQEASIPPDGEIKIAAGDVELAVAWKNGYFQFDQASLRVIMRQIGRWYNLDIKYAGAVPDRVFKGKIQRSLPLSGILNLLQEGDIHFKVEGKVLTVME
jgi:transmembrane sensor